MFLLMCKICRLCRICFQSLNITTIISTAFVLILGPKHMATTRPADATAPGGAAELCGWSDTSAQLSRGPR